MRSECQTVWIQTMPDFSSGLIQVKTVCKSHEQTTLGEGTKYIPWSMENICKL